MVETITKHQNSAHIDLDRTTYNVDPLMMVHLDEQGISYKAADFDFGLLNSGILRLVAEAKKLLASSVFIAEAPTFVGVHRAYQRLNEVCEIFVHSGRDSIVHPVTHEVLKRDHLSPYITGYYLCPDSTIPSVYRLRQLRWVQPPPVVLFDDDPSNIDSVREEIEIDLTRPRQFKDVNDLSNLQLYLIANPEKVRGSARFAHLATTKFVTVMPTLPEAIDDFILHFIPSPYSQSPGQSEAVSWGNHYLPFF